MATDQEIRLEYLIKQLEENRITPVDAAREVRGMTFPKTTPPTTWQRMSADATGDPEVPETGSFFPVTQAYTAGRIDRTAYEALARAAAQSMKSP